MAAARQKVCSIMRAAWRTVVERRLPEVHKAFWAAGSVGPHCVRARDVSPGFCIYMQMHC